MDKYFKKLKEIAKSIITNKIAWVEKKTNKCKKKIVKSVHMLCGEKVAKQEF